MSTSTMKTLEKLLEQMISNNEKENNSKVKFSVGESEVSKKDFSQSEGFFPLVFLTAELIDKMANTESKWTQAFKVSPCESGFVNLKIEASDDDEKKDIPMSPFILSMSAALENILNPDNNPYILISDEDNSREVDLISLVNDLTPVVKTHCQKVLSINTDESQDQENVPTN